MSIVLGISNASTPSVARVFNSAVNVGIRVEGIHQNRICVYNLHGNSLFSALIVRNQHTTTISHKHTQSERERESSPPEGVLGG